MLDQRPPAARTAKLAVSSEYVRTNTWTSGLWLCYADCQSFCWDVYLVCTFLGCREQAASPRIITTRGRAGNFSNRSTGQIRK